jgi:hypothetical protein
MFHLKPNSNYLCRKTKRAVNFFAFCVIVLWLSATATSAQTLSSHKKLKQLSPELKALIKSFRELREKSRRLPQGVFDKDLSGYGAKLHRTLIALGQELGKPAFTKREIVEWMGKPDRVYQYEKMRLFLREDDRVSHRGKKYEYLIYFWRGGHDFLYFISERGKIIKHDWWAALE